MYSFKVSISIGIPTYNCESTIQSTIESLINQTYTDWVCVISDNNSADSTVAIVDKLISGDSRFKLVVNNMNIGQANNFNNLVNFSQRDYFLILFSDDILCKDALSNLIEGITSNDYAMCVGRRNVINQFGQVILRHKSKRSQSMSYTKADVIRQFMNTGLNPFSEPSFVLFRNNLLSSVDGFSEEWSYMIDLDCYLKVLDFGNALLLESVVGYFRISKESWSSSIGKAQVNELKDFIDFLHMNDAVDPKILFKAKIRVRINSNINRGYVIFVNSWVVRVLFRSKFKIIH